MRLQIDALHQIAPVVDALRERHVEHRTRRSAQLEAGEFGVAHDADDAERVGHIGQVETEVVAERLLVALEEALHERFIHDRDVFRGLVVRRREGAPANDRHAEVLQVIGAHAIPGCASALAHLERGMSFDHHELAPVVGERIVERESGALHAGQRVEPRLDRAVEGLKRGL